MSNAVLACLDEMEKATKQNRELLNEIVVAVNEMSANLELLRHAVLDQGSALAHLEAEVSRLAAKRLAKLTPLPQLCEGTNG